MAQKKVKNIKISEEELNKLSKEELINRFIQIQEHNIQLKNIISKLQHGSCIQVTQEKANNFDFSKCEMQHIFLRFLYLGWDYHGYAAVEDSINTIEHFVIEALKKSCLIESRETAEYNRCGRTDKGVSAFSQVISIKVRKGKKDYCGILNRLLPQDIRVTGWCPIESGVSARFNCTRRVYRYFFPKGNLNINAMVEAARFLKGSHDFRNLCKMDVANGITNFTREIIETNVMKLPNAENNDYGMYELRVVGSGFLWHQIRCIMSVLIMVGQGLEKPNIIKELLDVQQYPKKPQYNLAGEVGLCLFDTDFNVDTPWSINDSNLLTTITDMQKQWAAYSIKTEMIRAMLRELEKQYEEDVPKKQIEVLLSFCKPKQHTPLLSRNTCKSLEERVVHYRKKFKSNNDDIEPTSTLDNDEFND